MLGWSYVGPGGTERKQRPDAPCYGCLQAELARWSSAPYLTRYPPCTRGWIPHQGSFPPTHSPGRGSDYDRCYPLPERACGACRCQWMPGCMGYVLVTTRLSRARGPVDLEPCRTPTYLPFLLVLLVVEGRKQARLDPLYPPCHRHSVYTVRGGTDATFWLRT